MRRELRGGNRVALWKGQGIEEREVFGGESVGIYRRWGKYMIPTPSQKYDRVSSKKKWKKYIWAISRLGLLTAFGFSLIVFQISERASRHTYRCSRIV